jgi:hypothetical protein
MTQSMTSIRNKPWVYDRVYVKSIIKLTPEDVRYATSLFVAVIGDFRGKSSQWTMRSIPATDKFPACSVAIREDVAFTESGKDIDKIIGTNLKLKHTGDICSYYVMNARDINQAFRYITEYAKMVRATTPTPSKATPSVIRDPFTHGFSLGEISRRCSYMKTQEERKERLRRAQMGKPHNSLGGGGSGSSRRKFRSRKRNVAKSKRHYSRRN